MATQNGDVKQLLEMVQKRFKKCVTALDHKKMIASILLFSPVSFVAGFSSKAGQCTDDVAGMVKGMGGKDANIGWKIGTSAKSYKGGQKITVTVTGAKDGATFTGLLLYAIARDTRHIGKFDVKDGFQPLAF